jgi:hypothetical protein
MKKQLLLAFAAGFLAVSVNGQAVLRNTKPVQLDKAAMAKRYAPAVEVPVNRIATVKAAPVKTANRNNPSPKVQAVTKVDIATSGNIYGSLISESSSAGYCGPINVLSYTNRKSIGVAGNSGYIQTHVSYDKGATWDTTLVVTNNTAPVNRYPQGIVVNPPGNTTANQAYAVVSAPMLDGSNWDGATLASLRLDNTNGSLLNVPNATATITQWMPRLGMFAGSNANVYALSSNYDYNSTATVIPFNGGVVNRGVWNGTNNNFTWDQTNIAPSFSIDPADGSQNLSNFGNLAFSPDGQTGYFAILGRDATNDHLSPMPIVYRTTDGGATWSLYSTADYTAAFTGILPNNAAGFMRPFFVARNGFDMSVDAWGKLHIACEVAIAFSNNPDSLNFLNYLGAIFDTYEGQNGVWNTHYIGTVWSEPVDDVTNLLGYAVGWDARLQITRSSDGYKMGYTWLDTDLGFSTGNDYPNLVGAAADFQNLLSTDTVNFTIGGSYDGNNYWSFNATDGWYDATSTNFVVPTFTSRSLNGGLDTDPWMHEWVGGIEWAAADFVNPIVTGINQVNNTISAASVYPNPARGNATVSAEIVNAADVTITLTNTMGQTVKSFEVGNVNAGKVNYSMDITDVKAGFYIVTINANGAKAVSKLNVQ